MGNSDQHRERLRLEHFVERAQAYNCVAGYPRPTERIARPAHTPLRLWQAADLAASASSGVQPHRHAARYRQENAPLT
jgi:hypothetical protein